MSAATEKIEYDGDRNENGKYHGIGTLKTTTISRLLTKTITETGTFKNGAFSGSGGVRTIRTDRSKYNLLLIPRVLDIERIAFPNFNAIA